VHAQRPSPGVCDDDRGAARRDAHDPAVDKAGPDLTVRIGDDVLRLITGDWDYGDGRRRNIRERVDRRRLPTDGANRRLG